jgi:hypothetical protein
MAWDAVEFAGVITPLVGFVPTIRALLEDRASLALDPGRGNPLYEVALPEESANACGQNI